MVIAPKTAQFSRRRFLSITAAAAGLPLLAAADGRAEPSLLPAREMRWRGTALGAQASMTLHTISPGAAEDAVRLVIDEVDRLENIFSLYRPDSELVRLNAAGRLDQPSLELVELLSMARNFSEITDGAFDVTVQPLWQLYAASAGAPSSDTISQTLKSVGFRYVTFGPEQIILSRPGAGITLNGIAQGYITDRVAEVLKANGFDNVLVNLGEIRALGGKTTGGPWRVELPTAASGGPAHILSLSDRAVATSARQGLVFDAQGRHHHIFDPAVGRSTRGIEAVSVVADAATTADALSTALMVGNFDRIEPRLKALGSLEIVMILPDGTTREWEG